MLALRSDHCDTMGAIANSAATAKKRKPGSLHVVANLFCMMSCTVIETLRNCRHRDVSHISMPSEVTASDRQAHLFLECNGPNTKTLNCSFLRCRIRISKGTIIHPLL